MPDEVIADLRRRVAATCWPSQELVADGSQGVQLATMQELARYWATDYDWRACEARLNALPQFKTQIDGLDIHFIHVRSRHENALPLIITHGWPGSVIEMLGVVGPLTDPTAHGGSAEDAFDLVLPSLPGYGFSAAPTEVGWDPGRVARAWAELMSRLGYARYVAQGGDIGANVTDAMGRLAPDGLLGIHLNFLSAFPTIAARPALWDKVYPEIPPSTVTAATVPGNRFTLEGHDLVIVEVGHADTDDNSVLHVPDLGLVVAGDVIYNGAHLYLGESVLAGGFGSWRDAIAAVEALGPRHIVAGHQNHKLDDDAGRTIAETRRYLDDADELLRTESTAVGFFNATIERYPGHLARTVLWAGASAIYGVREHPGGDVAQILVSGWL
jgi:pimeloyl-ACP methyl ester carboxylesterase